MTVQKLHISLVKQLHIIRQVITVNTAANLIEQIVHLIVIITGIIVS